MPRIKVKQKISALGIVFNGLKTYLYNLDVFVKYLSFPILGLFVGIFILFCINYYYVINLDNIEKINPIFQNPAVILSVLLIIVVPAFMVIIKALIDYIIAFGVVNSMCVLGTKRITDLYNHKEVIKRRFPPYCLLMIILSLIFGIFLFPLFWPLFAVALVFLSLSVQIFTLEENIKPLNAIKKSISLVKLNFWKVLFVLVLIALISYVAVPYLISWAVAKTPVFQWLASPVERYISLLPVSEINSFFASVNLNYTFDIILIAENIVYGVIISIIAMYMLPFRSACCVELYKVLNENYTEFKNEEYPIKSQENKKKNVKSGHKKGE